MTDETDDNRKLVAERRSPLIIPATTQSTEDNVLKERNEATMSRKKKSIVLHADDEIDDQLSDSSINFVTPSPKSVANELDNNEKDDSNNEPSAIEIVSDDRISSEELEIITEKCTKKSEWFIETLRYVRDLSTTKRLNRLVRLWFRIQEMDNFRIVDGRNNEHKLSMTNRPRFFEAWMQSHRTLKRKIVPDLNSISEFFEQYQQWWSSLQPNWRTNLQSEPFTKASPPRPDWSKLCRTGPNGITLVVLALAWMSSYIRSDNALFPIYDLYVKDATWAFAEMVQWIERGRQVEPDTNIREESEASVSASPKTKKRGRPANNVSNKPSNTIASLYKYARITGEVKKSSP
ncbi:hypothetical protein EV363DRAFT_1302650 [Boletus edulis]|nr:hypothetical protein EV363DRAFT_1302650 [Boletus edulis]